MWSKLPLLHPKRLFLIDFIGALISAASLGLLLASLESVFGVPATTLYVLAAIALGFFAYSFTSYLRLKRNWSPYLRGIATLNLLYCGLTAVLVFFVHTDVTLLGALYFIGEILLVAPLALLELNSALHHPAAKG